MEFIAFCADHGIARQHTETDKPHSNGVAERANRTMADAITAMLIDSKLPESFWGHACEVFVHTHNRTPTSSTPGSVPYTLFHDKQPDISRFRVFGCPSYVFICKWNRIFVGYPERIKGWLFWDLQKRKFIVSSHAQFDERHYPGNSTIWG